MKIKFQFMLLPLLLFVLIPWLFADSDPQTNNTQQNTPSKIAFASKRDGNSQIYTINEDGSGLKRLTMNKINNILPKWSPDGARILYISVKGKKHEILTMDTSGGNQIKLADDCDLKFPPVWSPDNTKVLFTGMKNNKNAIFIVNADGSNLTRLTENRMDCSYPSWSPDGSKILYLQKYNDEIYIYVMNPDGTNRVRLTREKGIYTAPTWSPDGQKVAYVMSKKSIVSTENKIYVINADGSNNLEISDGTRTPELIKDDDDIHWSADGKTIAFTKVAKVQTEIHGNGSIVYIYKYGIYTINADGNGYDEQLAFTDLNRVHPYWAQNTPKLAYLLNSNLVIYDMTRRIDSSFPVNVSIPLSPVLWTSDGTKLLFAGKNSSFGKSGLYLASLDGKITKLTENNDFDPDVWAAKGNH